SITGHTRRPCRIATLIVGAHKPQSTAASRPQPSAGSTFISPLNSPSHASRPGQVREPPRRESARRNSYRLGARLDVSEHSVAPNKVRAWNPSAVVSSPEDLAAERSRAYTLDPGALTAGDSIRIVGLSRV